MLTAHPFRRNLDSTTRAGDLLLRAAFAPLPAARAAYETWRGASSRTLRQLPAAERLLPLLAPRIDALTTAADEREAVAAAFREAWATNLRLVSAAAPAVEALRVAGIPALLLKGAALAFRDYPSPGLRPMGDVDVLVPAPAGAEARRLLEKAGYSPGERHVEGFLDSIHGVAFRGPDGLEVDLHWHALLERPSAAADALLFEDASALSLPGLTALAPAPEAHLLLVAVHAQRWSAAPHLVGLADTAVLLGRAREERLVAVVSRARELGLLAPLARTVSTLEAALPGIVPPALSAALEREEPPISDRIEGFLRRCPPGLLQGMVLHWLAHRAAMPGSTTGERLREFPARMRRVWGLGRDGSVIAATARRASSRIGPGRGAE